MSRLEKLLLAFLAVLLAAIVLLGTLLWLEQRGATPPETIVDARQANIESAPDTAKGAYVLAQQQATAWAPDATLLSARGNWPVGNFDPQAGSWAFIFFSPGQSATALITVAQNSARLMTSGTTDRAPAIADASLWQVDSPQAIATLLANGGEEFISGQEQVRMRLSLSAHELVSWTATLVDESSRETFNIEIEAISGNIIAQD